MEVQNDVIFIHDTKISHELASFFSLSTVFDGVRDEKEPPSDSFGGASSRAEVNGSEEAGVRFYGGLNALVELVLFYKRERLKSSLR